MSDDDQMWVPVPAGSGTVTLSGTTGPIVTVAVPCTPPGPGVFDVMQVTGWRPTDPRPSTVALSDADVERIARRVAELLRGAP